MQVDHSELDAAISDASGYDTDYLYYLVGSSISGPGYVPQSAGEAAQAGKSFLERFQTELQGVVCGKDGPYEMLVQGIVTQKNLPAKIAVAVMTGVPVLGGVAVTYLLAAYIALVLVRAGLGAYCAKR
jgi:hypothetical protein